MPMIPFGNPSPTTVVGHWHRFWQVSQRHSNPWRKTSIKRNCLYLCKCNFLFSTRTLGKMSYHGTSPPSWVSTAVTSPAQSDLDSPTNSARLPGYPSRSLQSSLPQYKQVIPSDTKSSGYQVIPVILGYQVLLPQYSRQ